MRFDPNFRGTQRSNAVKAENMSSEQDPDDPEIVEQPTEDYYPCSPPRVTLEPTKRKVARAKQRSLLNRSHLGAKSSLFQAKIRSHTRLYFTVALIKNTECTGLSKRNGAKLRASFCPAAASRSRPRQAGA